MPRFEYELKGYLRVSNKLRRLAVDMEKELDPTVYRWGQQTRTKLRTRPYPAMRPRQKYRRSGRLANSWAVERMQPSRIRFLNRAQARGKLYATYVIGDARRQGQAWMHRGRWWLARDVIEEEVPALRNAMLTEIRRIWDGP